MKWGVCASGLAAIVIGTFWLGAWFTGYAARHSLAGYITMQTNMALGLVLGGTALLLLRTGSPTGVRRRVGISLATIVLLIGGLNLGENLLGLDFGIDQLLAEAPREPSVRFPNRIGYAGSVSLVLLSIGLLALGFRKRVIVPYPGLAVCLINLIPAVGYLYDIRAFHHIGGIGAAWPTVVGLISLGIGLVMTRTDGGPIVLLLSDDAGGKLLRQMLPWVIIAPLALLYLRVTGERLGLYDAQTGRGLLAIALLLVFSVILWRGAAQISRLEAGNREARMALDRAYSELQERARELETANESLSTSNEELTCANEELAATTEELHAENSERQRAEEALRGEQEHKLEFYQRTILAATDGKLVIADSAEIAKIAGPGMAGWMIRRPEDVAIVRHGVAEIAQSRGVEDPRLGQLAVAVGEAATNALKHAHSGEASVHETEDSIIAVVSDHGPGIPALALPDVALRRRYSTTGTLGMGYKLIIRLVDKVYLATSEQGTTVAMEMKLKPPELVETLLAERPAL